MPCTHPNSANGWERLKVHPDEQRDDRGADINAIRMYIGDVAVFLVLIRDSLPRNQRQICAQKTFAVFELDASTPDGVQTKVGLLRRVWTNGPNRCRIGAFMQSEERKGEHGFIRSGSICVESVAISGVV